MRTTRTAAVLAAAAGVLTALPAGAAPPATLVLEDVRGDANAVNGQGVVADVGDHVGPVQRESADIVAVTYTGTRSPRGACTGFTAVLELGAPPEEGTMHRLLNRTTYNQARFWLQYDTSALKGGTTIRYGTGDSAGTVPLAPAVVSGNRITITVPEAALAAAGERLSTFLLYDLSAEVRESTGETTAPAWDEIDEDRDRVFRPCR